MASITTRIRNTLNALWEKLLDGNMSESLLENQVVSDDFLARSKIRLISHNFESMEAQDDHPPMLFARCPQRLLDNHPIKEENYLSESFGNRIAQFTDYVSGEKYMGIEPCTFRVFRYLNEWAYTFSRRDPTSAEPEAIFDLQEGRGILPIEEPHGMLLRRGFTMTTARMRWTANMYEYTAYLWGKKLPHVIMLSKQSRIGDNHTILHGELAQLVTAMRNRAFETEEKQLDDYHDFEDYEDYEEE